MPSCPARIWISPPSMGRMHRHISVHGVRQRRGKCVKTYPGIQHFTTFCMISKTAGICRFIHRIVQHKRLISDPIVFHLLLFSFSIPRIRSIVISQIVTWYGVSNRELQRVGMRRFPPRNFRQISARRTKSLVLRHRSVLNGDAVMLCGVFQ